MYGTSSALVRQGRRGRGAWSGKAGSRHKGCRPVRRVHACMQSNCCCSNHACGQVRGKLFLPCPCMGQRHLSQVENCGPALVPITSGLCARGTHVRVVVMGARPTQGRAAGGRDGNARVRLLRWRRGVPVCLHRCCGCCERQHQQPRRRSRRRSGRPGHFRLKSLTRLALQCCELGEGRARRWSRSW